MEVLTRAFYAQHDTRTPVTIGVIAMGLNVVLSFILSGWFARLGWMPHGGLALANSVATALEATALFVTMRRRLKGIKGDTLLRGVVYSSTGTLVMGLAVLLIHYALSARPVWVNVFLGILGGGSAYALTMAALRVPELKEVLQAIRRRLWKTG
jgi:putative peptidoglycan lipid II flippase